MPVDEIRARVKKTISKISGIRPDQIGDHETFDSLEIDSLARLEVLVELEREFKLSVPDHLSEENLVEEIQSIDSAVELIQRNMSAAA